MIGEVRLALCPCICRTCNNRNITKVLLENTRRKNARNYLFAIRLKIFNSIGKCSGIREIPDQFFSTMLFSMESVEQSRCRRMGYLFSTF
jgi:hypothetical protein